MYVIGKIIIAIIIIVIIIIIVKKIIIVIIILIKTIITERSLEVELPTIWTHEKQRWEESEKRKEERKSKKRKSQNVVSRGRRKGLCTLSKVSKTCGFCSISKNDGRRGTFEEDLQRCIFRGGRSTRDMFIRAVRRSGR